MNFKSKHLICEELRKWFESGKYTQKSLEYELKISQAHLSKLFRATYSGYTDSFIKLCNYANVDVYDRHIYDPLEDEDLKHTLRVAIGDSREKAQIVNKLVKALGGVSWGLH